jgi:hypothetical protein
MKKAISFLLILLLFSTTTLAYVPQPTPTVIGTTGLIRMPSADVIPYKNINFGLDVGSATSTDKFALQYKFALGTFQGMELGVVGMDNRLGYMQEGVFVNMKYSLTADTSPYPLLLAIGVENLASFNRSDVYMVATKYIPNGSRIHFGFLGDFPGDKFRPLGALGYDTPFFSERFYFLTDMFAGDNIYQLNLGFRWYVNESVNINLSALNVSGDDRRDMEDKLKDKDQKTFLIGFALINPL